MSYTAIDYIRWRGDLSFEASPVNEADEMLFACIGKPNYGYIFPENGDAITLKEAVDKYLYIHGDGKMGVLSSKQLPEILRLMAESERYGKLLLSGFVNKVRSDVTEQFSALTVHGPDNRLYVTFRGTDDTLVGWKENCELAICESVPAQRDATAYLEEQAGRCDNDIVVCGHSKGGNLAIFAACGVPENIRRRIVKVISYDGPGFLPAFFEKPEYAEMRERIITYVPYRSIVGMLMREVGALMVVSCDETGVEAHDVLLWNVDREGFVKLPELSKFSVVFNSAIDMTLDGMDTIERKVLIDEIFVILYSTGAFQLSDFTENTFSQLLEMANHFRKAPMLRNFLLTLSELYLKGAVRSKLPDKESKENKAENAGNYDSTAH